MLSGLRKLFGSSHKASMNDDWPSVVLLLDRAILLTAEQAVAMAREAWGAAGTVELIGSVKQHSFVVRITPLTFAFHAAPQRYEVDMPEPSGVLQTCWDQHRAWFSIDLPGNRATELREQGKLGSAYMSIMHFVSKHWSPNILAAYFPAEGTTLPNHGDLIESIRWARQNGVDLSFLKQPKS